MGRADLWLQMQASYDLWQARQKALPVVQRAPVTLMTHVVV